MPTVTPQSSGIRVPLYLVLSSDHISIATGKTLAITISKNGAAFGNPSAGATNATEIASGWYYVDLSATDTGTLGPLIILGTATACDPSTIAYQIALDPTTVRTGTAQAGNANSITLDSGASATNDIYKGETISITSSTGAGQARVITNYNGNTKVATVDRSFVTAPSNTSMFAIFPTNAPSLNTNLQVTANVSQAVIRSGTAQTGSTSNTIKLDTGASATNGIYVTDLVTITGGTGLGQTRTIVSYNGTTKVATVDRGWTVTPDNTSTFNILASVTPSTFSDQGVAQAGGSTTITLQSTASATNSIYNGSLVTILSGTGSGQTREITGYVGSTKVATVDSAWSVNPDSTSAYAVIPTAANDSSAVIVTYPANFSSFAISTDGGITLADAVAHGGTPGSSTATFAMQQMNITNPNGIATIFESTGMSGQGLMAKGVGGGALFWATDSSSGVKVRADADNVSAFFITAQGGGSATGLEIDGGAAGPSILLLGPNTTPGPNVQIADGGAAGGAGISITTADGNCVLMVPGGGKAAVVPGTLAIGS